VTVAAAAAGYRHPHGRACQYVSIEILVLRHTILTMEANSVRVFDKVEAFVTRHEKFFSYAGVAGAALSLVVDSVDQAGVLNTAVKFAPLTVGMATTLSGIGTRDAIRFWRGRRLPINPTPPNSTSEPDVEPSAQVRRRHLLDLGQRPEQPDPRGKGDGNPER
jgi:hypothetical protein